jgi:nitroreductase
MTEGHVDGERPAAVALAEAAATAGYAPSVHNTQPWRWRVHPDRLELYAERARQLSVGDPEGLLLLLSCGAALHHARLALSAEGWSSEVTRLPDPAQPDLLASITLGERRPVDAGAMRLIQAMQMRRTDRRPLSDQELDADTVEAVRAAARSEGVQLEVLSGAEVYELAAAAARAGAVEAADERLQEELAYWTQRRGPEGTGLPDHVLPAGPARTRVPDRDFGRAGTLPVGPGHDRAAVYGLLYGDEDEPEWWLHAGEALSAAWLTATELGVSVLPLSGAVEVPTTRAALRRLLSGMGWPYLVLRLGVADPEHAGPAHTPRMPSSQVVDTSAVRETGG